LLLEIQDDGVNLSQHDRQLLFFGRSTYCTKKGGVLNTYETRSVLYLFRFFFKRRRADAVTGTCRTVCDEICEHQACIDDFAISEETDECECIPDGKSRCEGNTECLNDQCRCLNGYDGNPGASFVSCKDINECDPTLNLNNCGKNSICTNFPGSFNCTCLAGFTGDPVAGCTDIDDCAANPNICGTFGTCKNNMGGYTCECPSGYQWDAPFGICNDINECATFNCDANSVCTNSPGSFACTCKPGYFSTGTPPAQPCADVNECDATLNLDNCRANSFCTNFPGSFNCTCQKGFTGDPVAGCTDIDECAANPNICGTFGTCKNNLGGYTCECASGYQWDAPFGICNDINECTTFNCGVDSVCTNSPGSFACTCKPGYFSTGTPPAQPCECTDVPNVCGSNAACLNSTGRFVCRCNRGFIGSPPFCQPDACTIANNGTVCGENTICANSTQIGQPSFCQCLGGYQGNATVRCTDIDECANPSACASTEQCINRPGFSECLITQNNPCITKRDSTCLTGLKCAQTSRSDATYICCPNTGSCSGGVCCNGIYLEGEACISRNSLDCATGLVCAPERLLSSRYICCKNVVLGACV
jgi:hypothetical protein